MEPSPKFSQQELLKQKLLAGEINPNEFIEQIYELDQSTPGREEATANLHVLLDIEVRSFFESKDAEITLDYIGAVSFAYFHVGQIQAYDLGDQILAQESFKNCLLWLKKSNEVNIGWQAYVEGTIAYFDNDIKLVEQKQEIIKQEESENYPNYKALGRLIQGLRARGYPDYKQDY